LPLLGLAPRRVFVDGCCDDVCTLAREDASVSSGFRAITQSDTASEPVRRIQEIFIVYH
jgi:hypothetical protein